MSLYCLIICLLSFASGLIIGALALLVYVAWIQRDFKLVLR